jgi:hypothetical protein
LRGGVDAGGVQDPPDRGRGDRVTQGRRVRSGFGGGPRCCFPGQAQDELLDDGCGGGSAWTTLLYERPFSDDELTVPAQECAAVPAKTWRQQPRGITRESAPSQIQSVGWQRTRAI